MWNQISKTSAMFENLLQTSRKGPISIMKVNIKIIQTKLIFFITNQYCSVLEDILTKSKLKMFFEIFTLKN